MRPPTEIWPLPAVGRQFNHPKPLIGHFFELSFKVGIVDFKSAPFRVVRLARYSSDLDAITPGRV